MKKEQDFGYLEGWGGIHPDNVSEGNGGIDGGTLFIDPFEIIDSEGIH